MSDDTIEITVPLSRGELAEAVRHRLMERDRFNDMPALGEAIDAGLATAKAALIRLCVEVGEELAGSAEARAAIREAYMDGLKAGAYQRGVATAKKAAAPEKGLL